MISNQYLQMYVFAQDLRPGWSKAGEMISNARLFFYDVKYVITDTAFFSALFLFRPPVHSIPVLQCES